MNIRDCIFTRALYRCSLLTVAVLFACYAQAQTSVVYVCQTNGAVILQNTQELRRDTKSNAMRTCIKKTIEIRDQLRPMLDQMGDPMPTAQTLIVGAPVPSGVRQQRDSEYVRIVQSELDAAMVRLIKLKMTDNNINSEQHGTQTKKSRFGYSSDLKRDIQLTESSINALKHELARIHLAQQ